jgi:hypothetical protein
MWNSVWRLLNKIPGLQFILTFSPEANQSNWIEIHCHGWALNKGLGVINLSGSNSTPVRDTTHLVSAAGAETSSIQVPLLNSQPLCFYFQSKVTEGSTPNENRMDLGERMGFKYLYLPTLETRRPFPSNGFTTYHIWTIVLDINPDCFQIPYSLLLLNALVSLTFTEKVSPAVVLFSFPCLSPSPAACAHVVLYPSSLGESWCGDKITTVTTVNLQWQPTHAGDIGPWGGQARMLWDLSDEQASMHEVKMSGHNPSAHPSGSPILHH